MTARRRLPCVASTRNLNPVLDWASVRVRQRNRVESPLSLRIYRTYQVLAEGLREQAQARQRAGRNPVKLYQGPGRVLAEVGEQWNASHVTVGRVVAVYEAAAADPDRYGHLVAMMERGSIEGAFTRLRRLQDEARVLQLVPVGGRFRTLVLDPPWDTDGMSKSCAPAYALMSLDAIAALPVPEWADAESHAYLWATNNVLGEAYTLMGRWGFAYKTILTWTKPHFGQGHFFRNTTEHVLFGVKGGLRTRSPAQSVRTDHDWPVGAHSEKPEGFYDLVRACSYPPYGEAFQRQARPDFKNLFQVNASLEAAE